MARHAGISAREVDFGLDEPAKLRSGYKSVDQGSVGRGHRGVFDAVLDITPNETKLLETVVTESMRAFAILRPEGYASSRLRRKALSEVWW